MAEACFERGKDRENQSKHGVSFGDAQLALPTLGA